MGCLFWSAIVGVACLSAGWIFKQPARVRALFERWGLQKPETKV